MRVISFSLWGENPIYLDGAIRNAVLADTLYPGWICRYYIAAQNTPDEAVAKLQKLENTELVLRDEIGTQSASLWRFEPADDENVELFIVRDADSRLSFREKTAVDTWLTSGKSFHIMRDHPAHHAVMMAGMWGARCGVIQDIRRRIDLYLKESGQKIEKGIDQEFLRDQIWPLTDGDRMIHDAFDLYGDGNPFPSPTRTPVATSYFVGEIITPDDRPIPGHARDMVDQHEARARIKSANNRKTAGRKKSLPIHRRRVAFADPDPESHPAFWEMLIDELPLELDEENPEIVIFGSNTENEYLDCTDALRLFLTSKCELPDFNLIDYAFGHKDLSLDDRHFQLPGYFFSQWFDSLLTGTGASRRVERTRFCSYNFGDAGDHPVREKLFHRLSDYKFVHAHGAHLNNAEPLERTSQEKGWHDALCSVLDQYKFAIVCEDVSSPGYTSARVVEALACGTIPIYWGNPLIEREFNPERLINLHCYDSIDSAVARIIEIDSSDTLFQHITEQPPFLPEQRQKLPTREDVVTLMSNILNRRDLPRPVRGDLSQDHVEARYRRAAALEQDLSAAEQRIRELEQKLQTAEPDAAKRLAREKILKHQLEQAYLELKAQRNDTARSGLSPIRVLKSLTGNALRNLGRRKVH